VTSAFARGRFIVAAAILVAVALCGAVPRLLADWRTLRSRPERLDLVAQEALPYEALVSSLPVRGAVGYLQPDDWPSPDAQRRFYLAQYALTPRLVSMGVAAEFVIVSPQASVTGDIVPGAMSADPRLAGFVLQTRFANGFRVFRRVG
jgi:hypothetical protein